MQYPYNYLILEKIMSEDKKIGGLLLMREKFPTNQISKLPKETRQQADDKAAKRKCSVCGGFHHPGAIHLDYVGHAALTDRLLDADVLWTWEPVAWNDKGLPQFDENGGLWIKLTVCGLTRYGYGNAGESAYKDIGSREKEVIGDALRNAAMRFGAALELWHKGNLHVDDKNDELKDGSEKTDKEFESFIKEHLPNLENPAKLGLAALQKAQKDIPKSPMKVKLWMDVSDVLKATAKAADDSATEEEI